MLVCVALRRVAEEDRRVRDRAAPDERDPAHARACCRACRATYSDQVRATELGSRTTTTAFPEEACFRSEVSGFWTWLTDAAAVVAVLGVPFIAWREWLRLSDLRFAVRSGRGRRDPRRLELLSRRYARHYASGKWKELPSTASNSYRFPVAVLWQPEQLMEIEQVSCRFDPDQTVTRPWLIKVAGRAHLRRLERL